jgi:hypothetical protein
MHSRARKTWFSVAIAAAILVACLLVALVGGGAYFVHRYISSAPMETLDADQEFDRVTARFVGQTPLLEQRGDDVIVHRDPDRRRQEIHALHVLTYDAPGDRLTTITVPGWLLRWLPNSSDGTSVTVGAGLRRRRPRLAERDEDFDPGIPRSIKLDDLERHGPGLVFDGRESRRRGRVLIWTE